MRIHIALLTIALTTVPGASLAADTMTQKLERLASNSAKRTPEETRKIMLRAIKELKGDKITEKAPKVGDTLPNGTFLNFSGNLTELYKEIGNKPAIITFYRGGWCPYCSVQLHAYQAHLNEIKKLGAELVAISPEKPDYTTTTRDEQGLEFVVLSDGNNKYARELGIVFHIDDELKQVYQKFGIDLAENQGVDAWDLPLAATFVIDKNRKIHYAFVDEDYKKRATPELLIAELEKLK